AGDLPGYPASHGCIRLPYSFARNLFGITDVGARVIVSDADLTPAEFNSPHLIQPLLPDQTASSGDNPVHAAATSAQTDISDMMEPAGEAGKRTRSMAAQARAAEREHLLAAITAAQDAKTAADGQATAAAAAAREAREIVAKERKEEAKLVELARKAAKTSDAADSGFSRYTAKLAKVDIDKIDSAALETMKAEEVAEETKAIDAADAAKAAQKTADAQNARAKQSVADAAALENARKVAVEDAAQAAKAVTEANGALAAADAIDARKNYPVSVFISRKTGRLTAKLGFVQVMDVPVTIADADQPLGTHVLTATALTDGGKTMRWNSVTLKPSDRVQYSRRKNRRHADEEPVAAAGHDADAEEALERIEIPKSAEDLLAELMKPGSSLIISDYGLSRETSERTEFVVEPWRSRPDSYSSRYY
ncbi:MAG: hypothetical protein WC829_06200, partial [Hyphomicrobium sp.]